MRFDPNPQSLDIGIIGAGAMGSGIAQIAALAGCRVHLLDLKTGAAASAKDKIAATLARLVEKNKLTIAASTAALEHLIVADGLVDLSHCALVVEAIIEDLEAKRSLVKQLEEVLAPEAVIASNTSSLSITAIAAGAHHPERIAGWHFFNPVPLMRVAEVIDGLATDSTVSESLMELTRRLGHTPVRAKDTPGFIVNHAGRGFGTEALRIIGEGVCDFIDVDRVMREAAGFRLGPFELMDLTALDVSHPVMESVYRQFYDEPRYRPSVITAQRLAGGQLGRKTGQGFYDYRAGALPVVEAAAPLAVPRSVWISPADVAAYDTVAAAVGVRSVHVEDPADAELCVVMPFGEDATTAALAQGLQPGKTVAIDTLLPLDRRRTVMKTPVTRPEVVFAAHALFAADGVAVTVIRDSAGFIAQRILAMIVNIACDIAQQQIASPNDIDLAVQLGLNYPAGPLAMGDALGAAKILMILRNLQEFYGDPRYRPSPWLTRRAKLGVSLLTTEGGPT